MPSDIIPQGRAETGDWAFGPNRVWDRSPFKPGPSAPILWRMRNLTALLSAALLLSSPALRQARRPLASEPGPSKEEANVLLAPCGLGGGLPKTPEHPVTAKYRPLIMGIRAGGPR